MLWVPLGLILLATANDLTSREIPHWISLLLLAWAVFATGMGLNGIGWGSLLLGMALGLSMAGGLFALGGLGGGDVKLLTALGAALGGWGLLSTVSWMAVAGGALAIVASLRGKRDLAYGPAIALGFLAFMVTGGSLTDALTF